MASTDSDLYLDRVPEPDSGPLAKAFTRDENGELLIPVDSNGRIALDHLPEPIQTQLRAILSGKAG